MHHERNDDSARVTACHLRVKVETRNEEHIEEIKKALPKDYSAKGDFVVFVDECHRTQSGKLHLAMKTIIPTGIFIGFTGTPLLKKDKKKYALKRRKTH